MKWKFCRQRAHHSSLASPSQLVNKIPLGPCTMTETNQTFTHSDNITCMDLSMGENGPDGFPAESLW